MKHLAPKTARPARPSIPEWRSQVFALGLVLCAPLATASPVPTQDEGGPVLGFSIPNTRSALVRMQHAEGHIQAERWNEAIADLQELIETHRSELVPQATRDGSDSPLHRGASGWAAEALLNLPPAARDLYRRRYEQRAQAALKLARLSDDRQSVIEVAERWPATEAAIAAWWTLGDLELEYGNLAESRHAWARALSWRVGNAVEQYYAPFSGDDSRGWELALERLDQQDAELGEGERRRSQLAVAMLADENPLSSYGDDLGPPLGSMRLPGPGEGAQGAPGPGASAWPQPFRLPPGGPFERGRHNLYPVRHGDTVFVSDSLQLFAINAYSGALAWASELSEDWKKLGRNRYEYFEGISREDTMIAPAASEHVVVSAHQIPISDIQNEVFRSISITTVIPDRRLYAYDTRTGDELWNHHPGSGWDGESGGFKDRMSVAGPPIISASRVLVPVYRMYGRIEFYVACYDLSSGEVLWSTQLVSGQRELNMFARSEQEFSAPPVRVEQDRVVVLTQLGAVAVLDLFSGQILWESLYDQITPPHRSHFGAQRIQNIWRNAPPVVADGVVIVTPFDSRALIGFDFETGETLWNLRHDRIDRIAGPGRKDINLLIGADERTIFLGSWPVVALRASGGLSREAPTDLAWRYPGGGLEGSESTSARALLLKDRVLIPTRSERIEVDRFGGGRRHKSLPWKGSRYGNLLVENGTLYALTTTTLDGYFAWDMLLARGRREYEEQGRDMSSSLYLASLLTERSRTELEIGRPIAARDWLTEAESLLDPFLEEPQLSLQVGELMHGILRTRGQVYEDLADGAAACTALRRARGYAPSLESLRDTLLEEYALLFGVDLHAREEVLVTLLEQCAGLDLTAEIDADPQLVYEWRFEPVARGSAKSFSIWTLPIPMWVLLERASIAAFEVRVHEELSALHELIEFWPDEGLPSSNPPLGRDRLVSEFARERLAILMDAHGPEVYAPFEARAGALLTRARTERDRDLLERVSLLYPFSSAGREANDDLLQWAIEQGDVEAVSEIALSELPKIFAPDQATPRERQLLLHVAAALESAGNNTYAGALYRTLSRATPDLKSKAPTHAGRTLRELAAAHPPPAGGAERPTPNFGKRLQPRTATDGDHELLGFLPAGPAGTPDALVYVRERTSRPRGFSFVAYAANELDGEEPEPLWNVQIPNSQVPRRWRDTMAFSAGTLIAATRDGVYALDGADGTRLWEQDWYAHAGDVLAIRVSQGLVLVTVDTSGENDLLYALDIATGMQVWRVELDRLRHSIIPLAGGNRVVLLPHRSQKIGRVLDLFSGRTVFDFELPTRIHQTANAASWIEDGILVVPWFLMGRNPDRNRIVGIDLWTGNVAWDVQFDEVLGGRRQLRSVVQHAGESYLILTPSIGAHTDGVRGVIAQLHVGLGATRRLGSFELEHDQRFIGISPERRVKLASPTIYLHSFSEVDENMRVMALALPFGNTRWAASVQLHRDELYNSLLRLPVESEDTLAMVFSTKKGGSFDRPVSNLFLLDKHTGQTLETHVLDSKLGTSNAISIEALGSTLLLGGDSRLELFR